MCAYICRYISPLVRSQLNSSCSRHKILFEWFPRCCIECKEYLKMHNDNIQCAKCWQRQYNIFLLRAKRWVPCGCYSVRCFCCFCPYIILLLQNFHRTHKTYIADADIGPWTWISPVDTLTQPGRKVQIEFYADMHEVFSIYLMNYLFDMVCMCVNIRLKLMCVISNLNYASISLYLMGCC